MATIKLNIPDGVSITPELVKRCQLAALPEIAEHHANKTSWKWDSEYNMKGSNRCSENTQWFLNNEVEL